MNAINVNSPDRELEVCHRADGGASIAAPTHGLIVDDITDGVAERLGASPRGL